jgi:hypothetical protein
MPPEVLLADATAVGGVPTGAVTTMLTGELVVLSRGLRPTLPIICVTGFVAAGDGSEEWLKDVNAVVEKPFSAAGLAGTVRAVLSRSA